VSVQGTLWSSVGTDWTHRRRWWHGRDAGRFRDARPPDVSDFPEPSRRQRTRPADDQWEWRHWRPEPGEGDKPEWDWGYLRPEDEAPEDADPLETPHPQE
jgi:hypothetical protein